MKYYQQTDYEQNRAEKRSGIRMTALCALLPLAVAVAAFVLRIEPLCIAATALTGCLLILLTDLKIMPAVRYGRHLREISEGSSHQTLGTLVRVSNDLTYENGVYFREVTLNVYEDLSEEGERRFLLDAKKEIPGEMNGRDVVVTSYGNVILEAQLYERKDREEDV